MRKTWPLDLCGNKHVRLLSGETKYRWCYLSILDKINLLNRLSPACWSSLFMRCYRSPSPSSYLLNQECHRDPPLFDFTWRFWLKAAEWSKRLHRAGDRIWETWSWHWLADDPNSTVRWRKWRSILIFCLLRWESLWCCYRIKHFSLSFWECRWWGAISWLCRFCRWCWFRSCCRSDCPPKYGCAQARWCPGRWWASRPLPISKPHESSIFNPNNNKLQDFNKKNPSTTAFYPFK